MLTAAQFKTKEVLIKRKNKNKTNKQTREKFCNMYSLHVVSLLFSISRGLLFVTTSSITGYRGINFALYFVFRGLVNKQT